MKRKRGRGEPGPVGSGAGCCAPSRSGLANVLCLQPLWTLRNVELDVVALGEAPEALRLDRCEVNEHVWTRLLRDKAKALRVVKPLHLTLSHTVLPLHNGAQPRTGTTQPPCRGTGSN